VWEEQRKCTLHPRHRLVTPVEIDHVCGHPAEQRSGPKAFFAGARSKIAKLFTCTEMLVDIALVDRHVIEKNRPEEQDGNEQENNNRDGMRKDVGRKVDLFHEAEFISHGKPQKRRILID
jgi:hypothetical protein